MTDNLIEKYNYAMDCTGYINIVTDTEYSIRIDEENKTIHIAFEGSGSKLDWKQNFTFWKKPYKHMKNTFFVHAGIFSKYKSVRKDIWNKILPLLNPDWKLRFYGFSQGATIVYFAHEDAVFRLPNLDIESYAFAPARGFTFISKKILDKRFENFYTIINVNDIVPKVPLLIQGYIHYGNITKLGKKKFFVFPWQWVKEHMSYEVLF